MSVSNLMSNGLSALTANQLALRTTSQNIANVNTKGYVRQDTNMASVSLGGVGSGVEAIVTRAADQFLAETHIRSISSAGQYAVSAQLMDRAQATLGDPSSGTSLFSTIDNVISEAGTLLNDPTSTLRRSNVITAMESAFEDLQTGFDTIDGLRDEANSRLRSVMESTNLLMEQIAKLNVEVQKANIEGTDANSLATERSKLLDELAGYVDFKTNAQAYDSLEIRTTSGILLINHKAAEFSSTTKLNGERFAGISISSPGSDSSVDITRQIQGGEMRGLLTTRDLNLVELGYSIGELSSALANAINDAANEGTAFPPPNSLTGRNTGLLATDSLNFTGGATFAVTDQTGRTIESVIADFGAGTLTTSAGAVSAIGGTIGGFATALNAAFGASAQVDFTDGRLSFSATGTNGVAIGQDGTTPSDRAGKGVSAFFGMNDIVTSSAPNHYNTGLTAADAHGLNTANITFGVRDATGDLIQTITYSPTGPSVGDLVSELNSPANLGNYGTVSLDTNGRLQVLPDTSAGISYIGVLQDETQRGNTGTSMSQLFGLGIESPSQRARSLGVRTEISLNPGLLPTSALDTSATAVGSLAVATGDNRGVLALQAALSSTTTLRSFSGASLGNMTVSDLSAEVAASAGQKAAHLENRSISAETLRTETELRRSSAEGVNLDEEMVRMTVYQQSYAASSRLITAAREMYDTLLNMV